MYLSFHAEIQFRLIYPRHKTRLDLPFLGPGAAKLAKPLVIHNPQIILDLTLYECFSIIPCQNESDYGIHQPGLAVSTILYFEFCLTTFGLTL